MRKFTRSKRIIGAKRLTRKREKPWAIVQYDNRDIPDKHAKLIEINKEYCKLHGYKYIFRKEHIEMSPWWIKVKICKELLETNKYSGILWLDTDAAIFDSSISLEKFTNNSEKHFFIGMDPLDKVFGPINAGVWMVKNTSIGNKIMKEWISLYKKENWMKIDNAWKLEPTLSKIEKKWAGINFEQGVFNQILRLKYKKYIQIYPLIILTHWKPEFKEGSFIGHFYNTVPARYKTDYYLNRFHRVRK